MSRTVIHLSRVVERKDGSRTTTTLCERMRLGSDGINCTTSPAEVTCKFCLRALARPVKEARA